MAVDRASERQVFVFNKALLTQTINPSLQAFGLPLAQQVLFSWELGRSASSGLPHPAWEPGYMLTAQVSQLPMSAGLSCPKLEYPWGTMLNPRCEWEGVWGWATVPTITNQVTKAAN